jgi:RHS repeat-associated protein
MLMMCRTRPGTTKAQYPATVPTSHQIPVSAVDSANNVDYATGAIYSPHGALLSLSNGSNLLSTYYYNARLQPCRVAVNNSGSAPDSCGDESHTGNVLDFTYDFHFGSADNGDVYGISNNRTPTRSQTFEYDALDRLQTAKTTSTYSTSSTNCWGESYSYDAWGNLLSISPVNDSSYNGCTQESGLGVTVDGNNRISLPGYAYDAAGNMTSAPSPASASYTYDAESELTQAVTSSTTGYVYDGDGRRVEKTSGGSAYKLYWYDVGGSVLEETDGSGSTSNGGFNEYVYFAGKRIARRDSSSNVIYYFADQLGSARVVTNASGAILDDSDFYAYGGERAVSASSGNVYKFEGKERDSESGLDDFGARYYSSQLGRFISADWSAIPVPVPYADLTNPQTLNLYAIVRDNPETFADLDGHDAMDQTPQTGDKGDLELAEREKEQKDRDKAKVQKQTAQGLAAQVPSTVKAAIMGSVDASNEPTSDDKTGGFHEESGLAGTDASGNLVISPDKPGRYGNPDTTSELHPGPPADQDVRNLRRGSQWRSVYFGLLESAKAKGIDFPGALKEINCRTGRIEASFASKLVATLDPSKPVIDRFVLEHFELRLPRWGLSDREARTIDLYYDLCYKYRAFIQSPTGMMIRELFDSRHPCSEVSELKKIDLVLWQIRP